MKPTTVKSGNRPTTNQPFSTNRSVGRHHNKENHVSHNTRSNMPFLLRAPLAILAVVVATGLGPIDARPAAAATTEDATMTGALAMVSGAAPAPRQDTCAKRDVKKTSYTVLRHSNGTTLHLLGDIRDRYIDTVHIWVNGEYAGQYDLPVNIGPDIVVRHEGRWVLETWLGKVRQVYKQVPIVKYCGAWRAL